MNINYYNPYVRQELMLYHHGVLGQKWGKQNGPPYPIAASAHSASEKKAGWRKSLSGDSSAKDYTKRNSALASKYKTKSEKHYQKMLDVYEKHHEYADRGDNKKADKYWDKMTKHRTKMFENQKLQKRFEQAKGQKISRFTPEQKAKAKKIAIKALKIVGAIAVAALIGYGAYKGISYATAARGVAKSINMPNLLREMKINENLINPTIIKENVIKENIIKENVIKENIIKGIKIR